MARQSADWLSSPVNLADSTASGDFKLPIRLVHELQGIELLICYSDGGAKT